MSFRGHVILSFFLRHPQSISETKEHNGKCRPSFHDLLDFARDHGGCKAQSKRHPRARSALTPFFPSLLGAISLASSFTYSLSFPNSFLNNFAFCKKRVEPHGAKKLAFSDTAGLPSLEQLPSVVPFLLLTPLFAFLPI